MCMVAPPEPERAILATGAMFVQDSILIYLQGNKSLTLVETNPLHYCKQILCTVGNKPLHWWKQIICTGGIKPLHWWKQIICTGENKFLALVETNPINW